MVLISSNSARKWLRVFPKMLNWNFNKILRRYFSHYVFIVPVFRAFNAKLNRISWQFFVLLIVSLLFCQFVFPLFPLHQARRFQLQKQLCAATRCMTLYSVIETSSFIYMATSSQAWSTSEIKSLKSIFHQQYESLGHKNTIRKG